MVENLQRVHVVGSFDSSQFLCTVCPSLLSSTGVSGSVPEVYTVMVVLASTTVALLLSSLPSSFSLLLLLNYLTIPPPPPPPVTTTRRLGLKGSNLNGLMGNPGVVIREWGNFFSLKISCLWSQLYV